MIDEVETLDFKTIKEAAEMARRGYGEMTAEPVGRQARIQFREYVMAPAEMLGFIAGFFTAAFIGLLVVLYMRLTETGFRLDYLAIALAAGISVGCIVAFFVALIAIDDWRRLQWKYKRQTLAMTKRLNDETRPIVQVQPGMKRVSRVTWQHGGLKELARRCHNEKGEWTAGSKIVRKVFEKPTPLYKNVSENYDNLLLTLFEWGWSSAKKAEDNPRWLNKGKMDLRGDLFIS